MIFLETNFLGVFALKDGRPIVNRRFTGGPMQTAEKLLSIEEGFLPEEKEVVDELVETGNLVIHSEKPERLRGLSDKADFRKSSSTVSAFNLAQELGIPLKEVKTSMRQVNIQISSIKLRQMEDDQLVIQAVNSLDELQDSANLLNERLREWYGLYFPELDYLVEGNEVFTRLVIEKGERENFDKGMGLDGEHEKRIVSAAKKSLGADLAPEDIGVIRLYAGRNQDLYETKIKVEDYVESKMKAIAPNLTHLAGPFIGARLIALAGSLKRLAVLPAGTIQVLGAEDAFFRFMKTGRKPPKHGIIFQYPAIRGAKKNLRGKLARTLAAKIAIAARADAFKGDFIAPNLLKEFKKRVKDLG